MDGPIESVRVPATVVQHGYQSVTVVRVGGVWVYRWSADPGDHDQFVDHPVDVLDLALEEAKRRGGYPQASLSADEQLRAALID